jgi:hypothetical protein
MYGHICAEGDGDEATHYCKAQKKQTCQFHSHSGHGCCALIPGLSLETGYCSLNHHAKSTKYCKYNRAEYCDRHSHVLGCCDYIRFSRVRSFTKYCWKCSRDIKEIEFDEHMIWHDLYFGAVKPKNICPYCERKDVTTETLWNHVQWSHPDKDPGINPSKNGRKIVVIREEEEEKRPYVDIPGEPEEPGTAGEAFDL